MSEYVLSFDGSCGPSNPDFYGGWGFTVQKDGAGMCQEAGKLYTGSLLSNNYSEFYGLYKGLAFVKLLLKPSDKLFIRGDSQLVINVMCKKWSANVTKMYYPAYIFAYKELREIRSRHIPVSMDWIPREMNKKADELSKYDRK